MSCATPGFRVAEEHQGTRPADLAQADRGQQGMAADGFGWLEAWRSVLLSGCASTGPTADAHGSSAATPPKTKAHTVGTPKVGTSSHKTSPTSAASETTSTTNPTPATAASWSLVTEPNQGMGPIYSLMSSAQHTLDMTMYELSDPQAVDILEADAHRGVTVRVLLDSDYESSYNQPAFTSLSSNGVQVRWAPAGTIFHQKTITVDDRTSAIMTLNLTSAYYSTSRDFAVITTDAQDVAAIEQVFNQDWSGSGPPEPGPTGLDLVWSPGAQGPIVSLIDSARSSLLVENEEMDDSAVTSALEGAAQRGVNVEVVMTYSSSWAGAFSQLVDAGVKVSTYPSDGSLYIHAKVVVADGASLFLGSQNFSVSSLDYNRELGIITSDPGARRSRLSDGQRRLRRSNPVPGPGNHDHHRHPADDERRAVVQRHRLIGQRRVPRGLRRLCHLQPAGRKGDGVGRQRHLERVHERFRVGDDPSVPHECGRGDHGDRRRRPMLDQRIGPASSSDLADQSQKPCPPGPARRQSPHRRRWDPLLS